jgi:hypothetical protein
MRSLLQWLTGCLFFCCMVFGADPSSSGRFVTGCVDRSIPSEFCNSVVRFQAKGGPVLPRTTVTTEQKAVESSLGEYSLIQPAQIEGSRASVLVQRKSGEFAVAYLEKQNGKWSIISIAEPSPARP